MREAVSEFRRRGLQAKKSFGQNFLADPRIAQSIADLASEGGGTVVEIGAGLGALTQRLLGRATVLAIERDRDLVPILAETNQAAVEQGRLVIVEGDAKTFDYEAAFFGRPRPHVVAGNLPYQLTGPLLEKAVGLSAALDRAVFMVQAEVAERLLAGPGTSNYGALTVFTSAAFRVERRIKVGRAAFTPQPRVDSAVVVLTPHRPARAVETDRFRDAVSCAFAQRRKTLRNAWSKLGTREEIARRAAAAGIDLDRRGETLSVEEFARFAEGAG